MVSDISVMQYSLFSYLGVRQHFSLMVREWISWDEDIKMWSLPLVYVGLTGNPIGGTHNCSFRSQG